MAGAFTDDDFIDEPVGSDVDPKQTERARELLGKIVLSQVQTKDKASAKFNVDGLKAAALLCRQDFKKTFPDATLEEFVAAFKAAFEELLTEVFG